MGWASIAATRTTVGGAAQEPLSEMVAETGERARRLVTLAGERAATFAAAEAGLRSRARSVAGSA
jgi:hypothetical protein